MSDIKKLTARDKKMLSDLGEVSGPGPIGPISSHWESLHKGCVPLAFAEDLIAFLVEKGLYEEFFEWVGSRVR